MDIIDQLVEDGVLKTPEIINAFRKIKRKDFLPEENSRLANLNIPLPIDFGQTNSQPQTVAFMFEELAPSRGQKILDVGSGSGWTSALLAEIVGKDGKVYGMEIVPELKEFSEERISRYDFIRNGRVKIILGDGRKGLPEKAPFDRILVSAASGDIPEALKKQLAEGGKMLIPIGGTGEIQHLESVSKKEGRFETKTFSGYMFVPLINNDYL
jgi:protein-L-isoaspartate(D-aspartate) O-methyltransferase